MKAAFCFYGPNGLGGPTTWVRRMLPRLARRGIDVVAVPFHTAEGACEVVADLRQGGVEVAVVDAAPSPAESTHSFAVTLARLNPDVIVADHVIPALVAGAWARTAGVPTVMVLRSDDEWYRHLSDTFLAGDAALRVEAVVAVSKELELAAVTAAPATVDVVRCPSGAPLPTSAARWRPDAFHAVYLGRLDHEQKRIPALVRALIAASRALPHFSATLYGDGPLRAEVERTLSSAAGHRVAYGGRLAASAVQAQLLDAQALVLLSGYEGLSSAVQEAMACGVPIIARRTASGSDGVLIDGETALVLESDSALTDAVMRLSGSEPLWCRLSAGGRRLAAASFDIEMAANRWSALLTRLGSGLARKPLAIPTRQDAEYAWATYLCQRPALDTAEAMFLLDRGRLLRPALDRFLDNRHNSWDDRLWVLHTAVRRGLIDPAGEALRSGELAHEAAGIDDDSDAHRYRVASLFERAGELDAAQDLFAGVAATTTDSKMRAGSFYHLAATARERGRLDDAMSWADACLHVVPNHRAAAALLQALTGRTDRG